jgi:hypothetical protein
MKLDRALAEKVFIRMSSTNFGLKEACHFYGLNYIEFNEAVVSNDNLSELYFKYKQKQALTMQESVEESVRDVEHYLDATSVRRVDPGTVALASLRAKTYSWMLERMKPEFYNIRLREEASMTKDDLNQELRERYNELKEKYRSEY